MGITTLTVLGWTGIMDKVNMQTFHKNGKTVDLVDAEAFGQNILIVHHQMLRIQISS